MVALGDLEKGKKFAGKSDNTKKKTRQLKSGQTVTLGSASFQFANGDLYRIKKNGELAKEPISKNTLTYKNIMNPKNTRVQTGSGKTDKSVLKTMMATIKNASANKKTQVASGNKSEAQIKNILGIPANKNLPSNYKDILGIENKISGLKIAENKINNNKPKEKIKVKKSTGAESWKNFKTVAAAQKAGSRFFMGSDGKKKLAITKEQLKKTGLSLREFANRKTKVKASKGALLKQPDNPGLKKLPAPVRNRMGFMKKGGSVGHTDYRKAAKGMLLVSVDMLKKKNKNK